jgi:drug/metabolite transporter (DMT)-like permease
MVEAFKRRQGFGLAMIIISGLFWSSIAILSKIGIEAGLDAHTLNTARLLIGCLAVLLYVMVSRRAILKVGAATFALLMVLGLFDYGIGGLLFIGSLHYISSSLSFLILYTYPAMVLVFSILIGREEFRLSKVVAVLLTFFGVALVLEAGTAVKGDEWIGVGMVLGAALIFAVYLLFVESLLERLSSVTVSFYTLFAGALSMLILVPFFPLNMEAALQPGNIVVLAFVALVSTAAALVLFLVGVRHVGSTKAAVFTTLEPVFVVIVAGYFLGDSLSLPQYAGMALQLFGVYLIHREPHVEQEPGL